jgi:hypothetical protein
MTEKTSDGLTARQRNIRNQNNNRKNMPRVGPFYISEAQLFLFNQQAALHGSKKAAFAAGLQRLSATSADVVISRELLHNLLSAASGFRGYIDAIPADVELSDMPGLDRDLADEAIYLVGALIHSKTLSSNRRINR